MRKRVGAAESYSHACCKGFFDLGTACEYAEKITASNKDERYVIQTGDIFFVSETCDIQNYEQLVFIYNRGVPIRKDPDRRRYIIGEQNYNNKYKTLQYL